MGDDKDASDTIEHAPIAGPLGKRLVCVQTPCVLGVNDNGL